MATDITKAITSNSVKHGTALVLGTRKDSLNNNTIDEHGSSVPSVSSVEEKYDARFDDPGYYGGGGTNSLAYLVKASYRLGEVSGPRKDRSGNGLDLTDTNTVGSIAGKQDTAASFVGANSESLSIDGSSLGELSPGNIDFSVGFWVYIDSGSTFSSDQFIAGVWKSSGNNREWMFLFDAGTSKIQFSISNDGNNQSSIVTGALSADTWYNIVGVYDASEGKKLYVNGSEVSNDSEKGVYEGTGGFFMGCFEANTNYFDGRIDEFNLWHRVLTSDNISDFYNSGNGKHVK